MQTFGEEARKEAERAVLPLQFSRKEALVFPEWGRKQKSV